MKHFIVKQDFYAIAAQEDLDLLIDENIGIMHKCISIAVDEAAGYLSVKYNVKKIMPDVLVYSTNEGVIFHKDDLVLVPDNQYDYIYKVTSKEWKPFEDPDIEKNCVLDDTRNQKLVEVVATIALYHLHKRLAPNNIPEFRKKQYDGDGDAYIMSAIKWLMMVREGNITPADWELKTSEQEYEDEHDGEEPMFDIDGDDPAEGMMWGGSNLHEYSLNGYECNRNVHLHIPEKKEESEDSEESESSESEGPEVIDSGWTIPLDPQPIP